MAIPRKILLFIPGLSHFLFLSGSPRGCLDIDDVSSFLAHQCRTYRRITGNLSFLKIHFMMGDDGISHSFSVSQVGEFHLAQEAYTVFRKGACVNDPRILK